MKHSACTWIALLLLTTSCATLDIAEIEKLEREEFGPVSLTPAWETHNMRIDVIRQTDTSRERFDRHHRGHTISPVGFRPWQRLVLRPERQPYFAPGPGNELFF